AAVVDCPDGRNPQPARDVDAVMANQGIRKHDVESSRAGPMLQLLLATLVALLGRNRLSTRDDDGDPQSFRGLTESAVSVGDDDRGEVRPLCQLPEKFEEVQLRSAEA